MKKTMLREKAKRWLERKKKGCGTGPYAGYGSLSCILMENAWIAGFKARIRMQKKEDKIPSKYWKFK